MNMIRRLLMNKLIDLSAGFPAIFLTGPRQSGKTTLSRQAFPEFEYISLENPVNRREAVEDPTGFINRLKGKQGVILDEVQRTPDLFSYLQQPLDEKALGTVLLTGSQHFLLSEKISQSLAGRAATLDLMPFSLAELQGYNPCDPMNIDAMSSEPASPPSNTLEQTLFTGFFPPLHDRDVAAVDWLNSYINSYVERDVRAVKNIGDLESFERFIGLCAGRTGQLLNLSSLGNDAGINHLTAKSWISILQASFLIVLLKPFYNNFSKRLVKSPKLYFTDTGLLCRLLGINQPEDLVRHPLRGQIFENYVVMEVLKLFTHSGKKTEIYFWRDTAGHEVDLLVGMGDSAIPVEIKLGQTVNPDFFKGLDFLGNLSSMRKGLVIYGGDERRQFKGVNVRPWWDWH